MRVIIFGVGKYYEKMKRYFQDDEIVTLLDNNPSKIGARIDGIEVLSPALGVKKTFDRIFVMCLKAHDVYLQLLELGVDRNKISTVYDMPQFYGKIFPGDELKLYCPSDNFAELLHRKKKGWLS